MTMRGPLGRSRVPRFETFHEFDSVQVGGQNNLLFSRVALPSIYRKPRFDSTTSPPTGL